MLPDRYREEMAFIEQHCKQMGVRVALSEVFAKGGEGGKALAQQVLDVLAEGKADYHPIYTLDQPLTDKIRTIATQIYGAKDVNILPAAAKELANIEAMGYGSLPVCMPRPSIRCRMMRRCWAARPDLRSPCARRACRRVQALSSARPAPS